MYNSFLHQNCVSVDLQVACGKTCASQCTIDFADKGSDSCITRGSALQAEAGVQADLQVGRGNWVAGAVRVCESVQESIQGALHQFHKGLLDGILLAAAQHAVLQDVGNALAVFNRRPEDCSKGLVLILVQQGHHLSTCRTLWHSVDLPIEAYPAS